MTHGEAHPPASVDEVGRQPRRRSRHILAWLLRGGLLAVIVGVTFWNVTRSDALTAGEKDYARHHYREALVKALDHLRRRPWSQGANLLAARCFWQLGHVDRADPYLRWAGPLGHDDLHLYAFAQLRADRKDRAAALYERILARWPDDALALRRYAMTQMFRDRVLDALDISRRLAESPDRATQVVGFTMVGWFQHQMQFPDRSGAAFERVLELDPALENVPLPKPLFWLNYASDLISQGLLDQGERALERGLAQEGGNAELEYLLGYTLNLLGRHEEAERAWRRSADLDPKIERPWAALGRLELSRGHPAAAISLLNHALELQPRSYEVLYSLILAHGQLGHSEKAKRLRVLLAEIAPRAPSSPRGMGAPELPLAKEIRGSTTESVAP